MEWASSARGSDLEWGAGSGGSARPDWPEPGGKGETKWAVEYPPRQCRRRRDSGPCTSLGKSGVGRAGTKATGWRGRWG